MPIQDHCGAVRALNANKQPPGTVVVPVPVHQTTHHWSPYGEPLSPKQQHGFSRCESSMSLSSSASAASLRIQSPPSISYGASENPEGAINRGREEDDNRVGLDRVARWLLSGSSFMFPSCSGYFWPDGDPPGGDHLALLDGFSGRQPLDSAAPGVPRLCRACAMQRGPPRLWLAWTCGAKWPS